MINVQLDHSHSRKYNYKEYFPIVFISILSLILFVNIIFSIDNIAEIESIFLIIRSISVMIIFAITLRTYIHFKNPVLIYLIVAITSLLTTDMINYALDIEKISDFETKFLLSLSGSNVLLMFSLFFFLLFFEAFNSDNVINKQNTILMVLVSVISTGLILSAFFVKSKIDLINSQNTSSTQRITSTSSKTSFIDDSIYFFIVLSVILIALLILLILITMRDKINNTNNIRVKLLLKQMRNVSFLVMIGPILPYILIFLKLSPDNPILLFIGSSVLSIVGLGLLIHIYNKGGVFLLQDESLRRIIIINKSGIPVYSYKFREFKNMNDKSNKMDDDSQEILFSGALSSISALLSEFSGSRQNVKSIQLENLSMMFRTVNNYYLIVIADQNTRFYYEALSQITISLRSLLDTLSNNAIFNVEEFKFTNKLIEKTFGFGKPQKSSLNL